MAKVHCTLKSRVYSAGDRATRLHVHPPPSTAADIRHSRLQPEEPAAAAAAAPVPKYKGFMTSVGVILNKVCGSWVVAGKPTSKDFPFVSRYKSHKRKQ